MNLFAKQKWRHRWGEQVYGHWVGKERWVKLGDWDWHINTTVYKMGFPGGTSGKEICQCRRHETWVQSLGQEDSLKKGMATHSSILAWRVPWTEQPGRPQSMGSKRVGHDWVTNTHFTCLLRNLYAGQAAAVRTSFGTNDWFKIERSIRLYIVTLFI